jgi:hypothetical protein
MKYVHVYAFFLMSFFHTSCGQNQTNVPKDNIKTETKDQDIKIKETFSPTLFAVSKFCNRLFN